MEKYNDEEMLLEEHRDLQKLDENIQKVESLKREYLLQKQQIGSLNNIILELKNQNNELKALSQNAKSLTQSNKLDNQEDEISLRKFQQSSKNVDLDKEKLVKGNFVHRNSSETNLEVTQQTSYQPKVLDIPYLNSPKRDYINLRQQPGHITTNRFYRSPQYKSSNQVWDKNSIGIKFPDNFSSSPSQLQNSKHMQIKARLMQNLVEEIQQKLRQAQRKLKQQKESHKQCKKILKQCIRQNSSLIDQNRQLISRSQLAEKQNEYLKQQLMKVTQQKHNEKQKMSEYQKRHSKFTHKISKEFDYQLERMQQIYDSAIKLGERDGFIANFQVKQNKLKTNKRKQSS